MKENRKIRLMQLVNGFSIGGAERKLLELIKLMDKNRYEITICSVGISGPLKEQFEATGCEVFLFTKKHKFDFTQVFKVANLMKKRKIDIVMTTLFYADIIGALAAKLAGVPHVVSWDTVSNPAESDEDKWRHRLAYRFCMRFVDKIIPVSDGVKEFLIKERGIHPKKIETIHYGVDLDKYNIVNGKDKRKELGLRNDDFIVGTVARLTVQKGHTYLIDAAPQIVEKFPNVKFVLVGDGPLREQLKQKVDRMKLKSHFYFLGFRDDVTEIVNTFDIFMLPSLFEGLPNVILEAMACSRPIIATAVDGTPEAVVHDECGLLVPPENPDALAENAIKLLEDQNLRQKFALNARKRVEDHFSNDQQLKKFDELYEFYYMN